MKIKEDMQKIINKYHRRECLTSKEAQSLRFYRIKKSIENEDELFPVTGLQFTDEQLIEIRSIIEKRIEKLKDYWNCNFMSRRKKVTKENNKLYL